MLRRTACECKYVIDRQFAAHTALFHILRRAGNDATCVQCCTWHPASAQLLGLTARLLALTAYSFPNKPRLSILTRQVLAKVHDRTSTAYAKNPATLSLPYSNDSPSSNLLTAVAQPSSSFAGATHVAISLILSAPLPIAIATCTQAGTRDKIVFTVMETAWTGCNVYAQPSSSPLQLAHEHDLFDCTHSIQSAKRCS